jgi:hypothetical protein
MRVAALACLTVALAACGQQERAAPPADSARQPEPAPGRFVRVSGLEAAPDGRFLIARVRRITWLHATPDGRRMKRLRPTTEFGSAQALSVVGRRDGWLRVISSRLPNHRRGWIPERVARLSGTDASLHVDRSRRRLELREGRRVLRRIVIAVGRPGNETPLGRFAVTDRLRPTGASPYGCCAVALTGHQTKLVPGWRGGDRLAIHGTPAKWSIGQAVSLGCMRANTRDMKALLRHVPLGAPVFIRA